MIRKIIIGSIIITSSCIKSLGVTLPELKLDKVKKDLGIYYKKSGKKLWTIEELLSHLPEKNGLITNRYDIGNFSLIHIQMPDPMSGCTFQPSAILVYSYNKMTWKLDTILSNGYYFKPIIKGGRYFISDIGCVSITGEEIISYTISEFKNGKFDVVLEDHGYDRYQYYLSLFQKGYWNREGLEGYEMYGKNLKEFKNAIKDTIVDYPNYSNFKFNRDELISCEKNVHKVILKGSYESDSLLTTNYYQKKIIKFNTFPPMD
jgi:hypothetical protein